MLQTRLQPTVQTVKRATVARSALDSVAIIFLLSSIVFWFVAFFQLLAPPALLSLLTIQAIVLALVYSLATPILWSALVPTTPAGQMLQKTQWRTVGFAFIVAAALYLSFNAEQLLETWLFNQPAIREGGLWRQLAISMSIAFILIPALAWTQLTPERWLAQIQQAHAVRKLELEQNGEIAIIKARLVWAKQKAAGSYAQLLPAEQREVVDTMRALFQSTGDTQREIARLLGMEAEITHVMQPDEQIEQMLDYVAQLIDVPIPSVPQYDEPSMIEQPADIVRMRDLPAAEQTKAIEQAFDSATQKLAPQRPAAPRSAPQRDKESESGDHGARYEFDDRVNVKNYAAEWHTTYKAHGAGAWTVRQLAQTLDMRERTARDRLNAWLDEGRAVATEGRGYFRLA